jgi:hypothetical protein
VTAPAPAPVPTPSRQQPLDLFADLSPPAPPPAPAPVPGPSSGAHLLFGDMTIKATTPRGTPTPVPAPAPAPAPAPSMFGDMVMSARAGPRMSDGDLLMIDEPSVQTVKPLDVFDPLLSKKGPPTPSLAADLAGLSLAGPPPPVMPGRGAAPPMPYGRPGAPVRMPSNVGPGQPGPLTAGVAPSNLGVMGQGMIPALQPRTIIPSTEDDGSAFSFIGGAGPGPTSARPAQSEEAFSFVKDAMRTS